jgi:hypothetical protein
MPRATKLAPMGSSPLTCGAISTTVGTGWGLLRSARNDRWRFHPIALPDPLAIPAESAYLETHDAVQSRTTRRALPSH